MYRELEGDLKCVIRAYKFALSAKTEAGKAARFQNLKKLSQMFETKWNTIMGENLSTSGWIRFIERMKNDEQIHKRTSR